MSGTDGEAGYYGIGLCPSETHVCTGRRLNNEW